MKSTQLTSIPILPILHSHLFCVYSCRQDHAIVDSVLSAPRSSYPDIVQVTERNVQSGKFHDLRVMPGYYTVATDRGQSESVCACVCVCQGCRQDHLSRVQVKIESLVNRVQFKTKSRPRPQKYESDSRPRPCG